MDSPCLCMLCWIIKGEAPSKINTKIRICQFPLTSFYCTLPRIILCMGFVQGTASCSAVTSTCLCWSLWRRFTSLVATSTSSGWSWQFQRRFFWGRGGGGVENLVVVVVVVVVVVAVFFKFHKSKIKAWQLCIRRSYIYRSFYKLHPWLYHVHVQCPWFLNHHQPNNNLTQPFPKTHVLNPFTPSARVTAHDNGSHTTHWNLSFIAEILSPKGAAFISVHPTSSSTTLLHPWKFNSAFSPEKGPGTQKRKGFSSSPIHFSEAISVKTSSRIQTYPRT